MMMAFIFKVLLFAALLSAPYVLADQQVSPLEAARLDALAARQDLMMLQGKLALAEQSLGECAAQRGRLEMMVSKAVIDAKQTEFRTQYEAEHPGFTWDFEQRKPVKRDGR